MSWAEIAFGAFGIAVVNGAILIIRDYLAAKNKQQKLIETSRESLKNVRKIYTQISRILHNSSVDRIIIFKTHNGSGLPSSKKTFKVSAIYGNDLTSEIPSDYQNLIVDEPYVRMLIEVENGSHYKYYVSSESEGMLKSIYKSEGVTYSEVHYIGIDETGLYYASLATHSDGEEFMDDRTRTTIYLGVQQLKELFSN